MELSWQSLHLKKNKFENIFQLEKKNIIKNLKPIATRKSSEKILYILAQKIPTLIGGSADLTGSNNTKTKNHKIIKIFQK